MENIYTTSDKTIANVINLELNSFEYLDFEINFKQYDGLIFTSRHAIDALNRRRNDWLNIPSYAIGNSTAQMLIKSKSNLKLTSKKSYGDDFARQIKESTKGKKLLYIRGEKVASNLGEILKCDEVIVYKNKCKEVTEIKSLPKDSFVIFTSPLLVECFLKHYSWDESCTAIAIGKTTAKAFPDYITPQIAKTPSLESCLELVYSHSN